MFINVNVIYEKCLMSVKKIECAFDICSTCISENCYRALKKVLILYFKNINHVWIVNHVMKKNVYHVLRNDSVYLKISMYYEKC